MTAPILARSRVLREAPMWTHNRVMWVLDLGSIRLGQVEKGNLPDDWLAWDQDWRDLGNHPTREAAMAAVEAAVLEIPEDKA